MTTRLGHLIVSGRWDNNVAIVDIEKALAPRNDATPNAIISRPRVTPDVDTNGDGIVDAWASGQPIVVVVDKQVRFAYVVNHSGAATPQAADRYQHGHPGLVTVVDLAAARDPVNNGTLGAVAAFIPTGRTGPTGCGLSPDGRTLLVNCGEAAGSEDGGDEVTAIDLATRTVVQRIPLAQTLGHPATGPEPHDSPHPSFGRYAEPDRHGDFAVAGRHHVRRQWRRQRCRGVQSAGGAGRRSPGRDLPRADRDRTVRARPPVLMAAMSPRQRARACRSRSKARRSRIIDVERAAAGELRMRKSRAFASAATIPTSRRAPSLWPLRQTADASSHRAFARTRSRSSMWQTQSPVDKRKFCVSIQPRRTVPPRGRGGSPWPPGATPA